MIIECCVCLEEKKLLNIKCNHPLCNDCFEKLNVKICPLCRREIIIIESKIKKFINIFIEICFFFLIVLFFYYTDIYLLNNKKERDNLYNIKSDIDLFFGILRITFEVIRLLH